MSYSDWIVTSLSEISDKIGDGLHGTPIYDDNGQYCFINGNNLNSIITVDKNTKKVNQSEYQKYKKDLSDRSILLSINGTIGKLAYFHNEKIILGKSACYINVKKSVDKKFIYYVLKNGDFESYQQSHSTGTTIKNLGLRQIRDYKFKLPSINEQKSSANILSSLDDKIELNNKINKNLEELAQTLYKRWFVDFEFPNEDGEPYKSSGGEMVESELGLIPKGWILSNLTEIADYMNGIAVKKYAPNGDEPSLPVLKIKELGNGNISPDSDRCNLNVPEKYIIKKGDLVFSWSGTLMVDFWTGSKSVLNQHLFKVSSSKYPRWFYYFWTTYHLAKFQNIAKSMATTMGHIKREDLIKSVIIIPSKHILNEGIKLFEPLIEETIKLRIQNNKLAKLRDELLPKLMNGEIEVPIEE